MRAPGSDVRRGDVVLERGTVLHAAGGEIGTLAFVGRTSARVYRRPVVALLSTGNELLDLQDPRPMRGEWGGIWDTNRPSLQAALEGLGYEVMDLGIVPDKWVPLALIHRRELTPTTALKRISWHCAGD